MIRIDEAFQGRDNRFTPIRIALASLVVLEHVLVVAMSLLAVYLATRHPEPPALLIESTAWQRLSCCE